MSRVRKHLVLFLPGGLVVLAALVLLRPGVAPDAIGPYVHACALAVLALGVFLGWYHNRSRIVFALMLLSLADVTLRWLGKSEALPSETARAVAGALAVLLPLNLAAYASLTEQASLAARVFRRLAPLLGQIVAMLLIARTGSPILTAWLEHRWLDGNWTNWTTVPQLGIAMFAGATLYVMIRYVLHRDPIDVGFVWALAAGFLALHGIPRGWDPTAFFATGGWVLIGSLLDIFRRISHDEVTELPERDALNRILRRLETPNFLALVRVDHFARTKELFGREVSDQVLRMVAAQLRRVPGGTAFRYGRDEFAVLFDGVSAEQAIPQLEDVRRAIASYCFIVRGPRRPRVKPAVPTLPTGPRVVVTVTVSIGAAERESREAHPRHVIRAAHQALRHAIETGRNQIIA